MARLYLGVAALYGGICGCHAMGGLSVLEQHMQNRRELLDAQSVDDAHRVQPGQCGVYKRGNAELALCVDSAAQYGQDTRQVNGFLVNRGNTPVCDLKVLPVLPGGARLLSSWPDWGLNAQYAYSFNPRQVTAVGLTSTVGAESAAPWVEVVNFRECAEAVGEKDTTGLTFSVVPIGQIRPQSPSDTPPSSAAAAASAGPAGSDKGAILSRLETARAIPPPQQQQQQQPHQEGATIPEGQCAQYTSPTHANAEATLCIESVLRWAKDVVQINMGKGLRRRTNHRHRPHSSRRAGRVPPLTVEEFYPCEQTRPTTPQRLMVKQVPIAHEFAHTRSDKEFEDVKLPAEHHTQYNGEPRLDGIRSLLASAEVFARDGRTMPVTELTSDAMAAATNFAVPDGQCGVYNTGNAELALCTDSTVQWGKDVTQINGFMTNRGSSPICELKVRAVLSPTSQLLSIWPDWAHKSSYRTNFSPGQASAVGLTATPPTDGVAPYIEVVSLQDCNVRGVGPVTFKKVPIASVQPQPPAPMSSSTMPPASKQRLDFNHLQLQQLQQQQQQQQPGVTIPEGKCGVYSVAGEGKLALCVESLLRWGQDVTQVNGFLENVGGTHLCDIKVRSENADTTYSVWPEWVQASAWKDDFAPKQVTAVGLTAPGGDAHPSLVVESFNVCGQKPSLLGRQLGKPKMEIMDISQVKMLAVQPEKGRRLSTPAAEGGDAHAVPPNRCKTFANGAAKLVLCTQEASHWGQAVMSLGGWVENVGEVPVCNVRLGNTFPEPLTLSVWPSGLVRDQISAGQRLHTGFTGESRPDALSPALTVVGFTECGAPAAQANAVPTVIGTGRSAFVKYESMKAVELDDDASAADVHTTPEGSGGHDGRRQLKQHPQRDEDGGGSGGGGGGGVDKQRTPTADIEDSGAPTTLQNINWDDCGYYNGKDGQSELALCWKSAKAWKNKKAGRVVQANLVVVNTGQVGVCNVTVDIENIDRELGDHYPKMIDDETGEDMFPSYPGYFAPQQILNIGAAVPKGSGYPDVGIDPSFTACSETPKKEKPRNSTCQPYEDKGVKLNFCVYDKLKIWVEYQGPRMVMVEGFVENVGTTTACNITVDMDGLADAKATWGEWMPTYPYKLQPTDLLKFGANIPWKHGVPKASLTKFENCSGP